MANSKDNTSNDYEVGYQKPPKATQFAKGQSGNPNGRPKGIKNWATALHEALEQKVTVIVNGTSKQVTKMEAATTQLANKAASGDTLSIRLLLQLVPSMEAIINKAGVSPFSNEQDRQVLAVALKRMNQSEVVVIGESDTNDAKGSAS